MSATSTISAPASAVSGRARRRLSPAMRTTRFGTTSPTKGIAPSVTTTSAVTTDTATTAAAVRRPTFTPSVRAVSSPRLSRVSRSAIRKVAAEATAAIHSNSYRPRRTPDNSPVSQTPRNCIMSPW